MTAHYIHQVKDQSLVWWGRTGIGWFEAQRVPDGKSNCDPDVVEGFGDEWSRFPQESLDADERLRMFQDYFGIFPWFLITKDSSVGADIGCGSGRWADLVAPRVSRLHLIDASSEALEVAKRNCATHANIDFHLATVGDLPFPRDSLDFAYSLGVLHHVPDTAGALKAIAQSLKPDAPFLLYLYYRFDNRPWWYRFVWLVTDYLRRHVSVLGFAKRYVVSQILAALVYWPLARTAKAFAALGFSVDNWPLSYYRNKSFYTMRTDALDRFGTRLEQRFTRSEIRAMLEGCGFSKVSFSACAPFWCALAFKRPELK